MITVTRYHDISMGHRVAGHESKCKNLHGHNYRIHFTVAAPELDDKGRVVDFGVIKSKLCEWLENNWDHKMILWQNDDEMKKCVDYLYDFSLHETVDQGIVWVPFNPTAENIAIHLVDQLGPILLCDTDCVLIGCKVEETAKCSAEYTVDMDDALSWKESEKIRQMNMRNEAPLDPLDLPF